MQRLQQKLAGSSHAEDLERMTGDLRRLLRLVNLLLQANALSRGELVLERTPTDLLGLVERAVAASGAQAGTVRVSGPPGVIGCWDAERLQDVVEQLLSNASRFGGGHPVELVVGEEGEDASLSVTDGGCGIALEDQERIFERFERGDQRRHHGGLGLGLWMVRRITEAHGGRVALRSAPGAGSTFTVLLPRESAAHDA